MALINCPECGKEISDKAVSCTSCGYPITEDIQQEEAHIEERNLATCPKCSYVFDVNYTSCPKCGYRTDGLFDDLQASEKNQNPKVESGAKDAASPLSISGFIISLCAVFVIDEPFICSILLLAAFSLCTAGKRDKLHLKKGLAYAGQMLCLVVIVVAVIANSDSSESDGSKLEDTIATVASEKSIDEPTAEISTTVEEQVIYENHDVIIRVMGCEELPYGFCVDIYIENNSDLNLGFNAHSYAVNGIMTRDSIYAMDCDVAAGKKANTSIGIDKSFLEEYDVDLIKTIDVFFWAYDNDAMIKEFETEQITISTNYNDGVVQRIIGEGKYSGNNIQVDYLYSSGNSHTFCLTNDTDNYFDFDVSNISINDYTVSDTDLDLFDEQILNGCQLVFVITVEDGFKTKNNIDEVEKIDFNLDIRPLGDYFNEWSTKTITYNLNQN